MSNSNEQAAAQLDSAPLGEDQVIQQIIELTMNKMRTDYPPGTQVTLRDAHPKSNGCVKASFMIEPALPAAFAVGLFGTPRTYDCWIRFSNGAPKMQGDSKGDVRGIAIKVMGVEGEKILRDEKDETTQDFLLCDNPVFFARDVDDYKQLIEGLDTGKPTKFFLGWNPFKWHLWELLIVLSATHRKIPSAASIRYWSQTPYRLGNRAVKYSVVPRAVSITDAVDHTAPNYLREVLVQELRAGDVEFDFMVQLQSSADEMPVEDPRVRWSEAKSPFRKVATIRIPAQEFDTPERDAFAENLSYTPWHSLPEHAPLGGINRVRLAVYRAVSKMRHAANRAPRQEPTA